MDATLPLITALPPQAATSDLADTPPWEVEAGDGSPPVRVAPRKVAKAARRADHPERIHWSVTALTVLTAVVLVFAGRAEEGSHSWVIASAAQPGE